MKLLKESLKKWNKDIFWWTNLKLDKKVEEVNNLDTLLEDYWDDHVEDFISKRDEGTKALWRNLHLKDSLLRQKARIKWLREGDLNIRS